MYAYVGNMCVCGGVVVSNVVFFESVPVVYITCMCLLCSSSIILLLTREYLQILLGLNIMLYVITVMFKSESEFYFIVV